MPLILVVDRDERVPSRVRSALGDEGWTIAHVKDVTQAMHSVASEAPELFLVSSDLPNAEHVLSSFARRQGGPGTIALTPEDGDHSDRGQDLTLPRSFAEADLRTAVGRILETGDRPSRPQTDEPKLTSHDIFGDLVAEVERDPPAPRPAASPSPPPGPPPASPRPGPGAGPGPGQGAGAAPRSARTIDDDMERKLEQTLSGVLGPAARKPAAPPPATGAPRPAAPAAPSRPARRSSDDVDKLISDTLSGLEQRPAPRRRPAPADDPFDLSELEALLDRPKKAPRAAAPPPPAPPKPAAPPAAAAPPASGPEAASPQDAAPAAGPRLPPPSLHIPPKPEEVPFGSLFAEEMREVPDDSIEEDANAPEGSRSATGGDFGQYRLLDRIGVGGMAEVWKARMTGVEGFQKTVAIKRILPHLTDSTDFVDMFIDEAKLAAQLNHANIIHIYDLGKLGDDYYIAMEYVEGENLRGILNRARERGVGVPEGVALYVAARLASALDYAHRQRDFDDRELGLVHRDVSPQNVLIGYEGTIKLCDFGIVKAVSKSSHTQMGALKGKLQYMSPEQAYGKPVDGRSDIFAVGALLFEMLTGRRLFVGDSEMEVLEAVRECRVAAPSELAPAVRPEVDAVVRKALAREPGERFQSASEMVRRLEEILASMRPVPGQHELSVFVARLFDREVDEAEQPAVAEALAPEPSAPEPPPPAAPAAAPAAPEPAPEVSLPAGAATVPLSAAAREEALRQAEPPPSQPPPPASPPSTPPEDSIGPWLDEPPAEGAAERPAGASGEQPPVEAVAPVGPAVEPEEGGRRGKGLLVAAILVALILGGLLAWYLVQRRAGADDPAVVPVESERAEGPAASSPPAAVAPVTPNEEQAAEATEEPVPGAEPDAAADAAEPGEPSAGAESAGAETPGGEEGVGGDDITRMIDEKVEEELARREELLRQQFEEEERRIQRQLRALEESQRAESEAAAEEEPPPAPPPHP